jgi:hypothetical protein
LDNGSVVPSTLFCETAPRNPELNGVVNGQLYGVDPGLFGSPKTATCSAHVSNFFVFVCIWIGSESLIFLFSFYLADTCPFGQTADVATCTCH